MIFVTGSRSLTCHVSIPLFRGTVTPKALVERM